MSSGSEESAKTGETEDSRARALRGLARELRLFSGLGASYFRAAGAQVGMNATDAQALDILSATGPASAGQLAELMGVTTGAVTQMLDRLEQASKVRRERDPEDGRRVIVGLAPGEEALRELGPIFADIGARWDAMAAGYDEAQLALLTEFLRRAGAVSRQEIVRLRDAPAAGAPEGFSMDLDGLTSGQLTISSGSARLTLRAGASPSTLYQARFDGQQPEVKASGGTVTIRYPRQLWGGSGRAAEVNLNATIPWLITIQSKAAEIIAELTALQLAGLDIKGGYSSIHADLPAPSGEVPVRISGGASSLTIRRPVGVAARVYLKGWVSQLTFDEQTIANAGETVRLQTPGYSAAADRYDIELSGAASVITVTTM